MMNIQATQVKTRVSVRSGRFSLHGPNSDLLFSSQDERAAAELARIAGQFTDEAERPENPNKGEDLLAMMDEL